MNALYRKYRPTRLEDVVGQDQVTVPLLNSLKQGKPGHAYLFIGPRGTGKTSVARIFAHAVNGFDYQLEDNYLDIIEIDAASNTGVDNIRELREKAVIAPSEGKYKVYIIDEVHMLSKSAANALLKTIEEPPAHVIFILATTEANKVPITISSRTQLFNFRLAPADTMFTHLRRIADAEKIAIEDDALKIIVRRGGGSFRDSLSLLDQIASLSDQTISAATINQALGLPETEAITKILGAYTNHDTTALQSQLRDLLNSGLSPETIAAELIDAIITEPNSSNLPLLSALPTVSEPFAGAKLLLALLDHQPLSAPVPQPIAAPAKTPIQASVQTPPVPKPVEPAPQPSPITTPTQPFSWETFTARISEQNSAVFLQLNKCEHELKDGTLHLYPAQPFTAKCLEKASQLLASALDGYALHLHNVGERNRLDPALSQIAAIMGDGIQELPPSEL